MMVIQVGENVMRRSGDLTVGELLQTPLYSSHFKVFFFGKPDKDLETRIISTNDWKILTLFQMR